MRISIDYNTLDNVDAIFHNIGKDTTQQLEVKIQYHILYVVLTYLREKFMQKVLKDIVKIPRGMETKFSIGL